MDYSFDYEKDLVHIPKIRQISDLTPEELERFLEEGISCPHCKKLIQRKNAIVASKTEKRRIDYHVQYLPAGGKRTREKYYLYDRHYYRCPDCDKKIKRVKEIEDNAHRLGRRIGLSVLLATFVIGITASLLSVDYVGWEEVLGMLFVWGMGAGILGVVLMVFLPKVFSKEAKMIINETGIDMYPDIEKANADYILED